MKREGVMLAMITVYSLLIAGLFLVKPWASAAAPVTEVRGQTTVIASADTVSSIASEVNRVRQQNNMPVLSANSLLDVLAGRRVSDMANSHYYAHESPTGTSFVDGLNELGARNTGFSCENLLLTTETDPKKMVQEWMASAPHRECLLDNRINFVGYSIARFDSDTNYAGEDKPTYVVAMIHAERVN